MSQSLEVLDNLIGKVSGSKPIIVVITGAAGQIGYSLIPLFANGQVFGNKEIILRLLEITPAMKALNGVCMEINDGNYPLVKDIIPTDKPSEAFKDADYAVLVGGFPRRPGMLRKDLLAKNSPIFKSMGNALQEYAKQTCKVLVVANPANTNCLVCAKHAPKIPKKNFSALTRLDYNRLLSQISTKLSIKNKYIKNVVIWGNHSKSQVPDINNGYALINNEKKALNSLLNKEYVNELRKCVQQRGKAIIDARGLSSAMSAANGVKDCLRDLVNGTTNNNYVSMGVYSNGEYGIAKDIFYSFPVICKNGQYTIVENLKITSDVQELMKVTEQELLQEKKEAGL